jgi:hypothetical protein
MELLCVVIKLSSVSSFAHNLRGVQDLYAVHSSQGEAGRLGHYYHVVEANGVRLAFIAVDATTRPGYRRPFNFIGRLNQQDLLDLRYGVKV